MFPRRGAPVNRATTMGERHRVPARSPRRGSATSVSAVARRSWPSWNDGVVEASAAEGLHVRRVVRADWEWIVGWFEDAELNRRLGPLDREWLEHVLSSGDGVQLVITAADGAAVGLAGCAWDPAGIAHAITDLAVCPTRRRSGLGRRVLASVLTWDGHAPTQQWIAFVDPDNRPAFEFFVSTGWHLDGLDDGMHRFSHPHTTGGVCFPHRSSPSPETHTPRVD